MTLHLFKKSLATLMIMLLVLAFVSPSYGQSSFDGSGQNNFQDYDLQFDQNDLVVKYGEYAELEFFVNSSDNLDFQITSTKPVGMDISPLSNSSFLLSGLPEFTGRFCFLVSVKDRNSIKQATERVCLLAEDNDSLDHPKFETDSFLSIQKNNYENISVRLEARYSHIDLVFVQGELPDGINYQANRGEFNLSGRTSFDGNFDFIVLAHEQQAGQDFYVYKQFQVEVKPDIVNRYQCDAGYYYDETLGYCVQNAGDMCPVGTFYDPQINSCVNYTRPTHVSCSPGSYYDHFLYRCVRNNYQRCPYNYEYDYFARRCIPLPYTCSLGYRYSYSYRSCIYVGVQQCGRGSHYSFYHNRCINNYAYCRAGSFWDGYTCRVTSRTCGYNDYWDPNYRSCRSRSVYTSCRGGYQWDYGVNRCVTRRVYSNRTCSAGTRYSPAAGRCVVYRPAPNRPTGPVVRPPHNRPVVVRPNRPVHVPQRPTTRPAPTPNRPSTRPAPTPNRPSTRPAPTPNRPSTRPSQRPSSPSTRPAPTPNRPSTRPSQRPSSPSTRPAPTPNRPTTRPAPSRPSSPSSRPSQGGNRGNGRGNRRG